MIWIIWKQENTLLGYDLLLTKKLIYEKNVSCFICMISFVAFSQENVVKECHFVQPDGSVKIGHEVFLNINVTTKCGTIYDPKMVLLQMSDGRNQ